MREGEKSSRKERGQDQHLKSMLLNQLQQSTAMKHSQGMDTQKHVATLFALHTKMEKINFKHIVIIVLI